MNLLLPAHTSILHREQIRLSVPIQFAILHRPHGCKAEFDGPRLPFPGDRVKSDPCRVVLKRKNRTTHSSCELSRLNVQRGSVRGNGQGDRITPQTATRLAGERSDRASPRNQFTGRRFWWRRALFLSILLVRKNERHEKVRYAIEINVGHRWFASGLTPLLLAELLRLINVSGPPAPSCRPT